MWSTWNICCSVTLDAYILWRQPRLIPCSWPLSTQSLHWRCTKLLRELDGFYCTSELGGRKKETMDSHQTSKQKPSDKFRLPPTPRSKDAPFVGRGQRALHHVGHILRSEVHKSQSYGRWNINHWKGMLTFSIYSHKIYMNYSWTLSRYFVLWLLYICSYKIFHF